MRRVGFCRRAVKLRLSQACHIWSLGCVTLLIQIGTYPMISFRRLARRVRHTFALLSLSLVFGLNGCVNNAVNDKTLESTVLRVLKAHPEVALSEAQILKVLREHPQVVVESVQAYQQKLQETQAQAQTDARKKRIEVLNISTLIGSSPTTGARDQQLVLVEFSDFQCLYCGKAYATVKEFMAKHRAEVTLVYKHLPLLQIHPQALPAAQAAWAAHQQGKFWPYHDALFANQGNLQDSVYVRIAKSLKLDIKRFERDRKSTASSTAIQADLDIANRLELDGTPFFLMNRTFLSGVVPLEEMERALVDAKQALAKPALNADIAPAH